MSMRQDSLLTALRSHFEPKLLVIVERFRFYQRVQKAGESMADFIADLHRLTIHCEFEDFLDQALPDRFVCGLKSEAIEKRLLTERDLTMTHAQEIACSMELADSNAKDLKSKAPAQMVDSVNVAVTSKPQGK